MPYIGKSTDGFGIRERFTYVVSAGATSISGADANGRTLTFEDPEYVDVFLNGVRLKKDTDYDLNTGNTVSNLSALAASDEVEVIVNDIFTLADMVSANNGGDFRGNLAIAKDSTSFSFGLDKDITLTHVHNTGLNLKNVNTSDDSFATLTFQTGDTDIAVGNKLGSIKFQAPDEGTGTDAILVAAGIEAVSEGDFSASNNATKLSFLTGASEAAAEKMSLSSAGVLTVSSNIVSSGTITGGGLLTTGGNIVIPDDGNIGSASDTNAIAISSAGVVTISTNTDATNSTSGALIAHSAGIADDLYVGDGLFVAGAITGSGAIQGTTITATTAIVPDASDGAHLGSTSLEFSDLYLADGALIYFGNDQEINITHVADTGLTTNGSFTASGTMQGTTITATTAFVPDASDGAALGTSSLEFSDLFLADGGEVKFGADQDVLLRHDHNSGLIIDRTNTSDNSPTTLTLQTAETDIQANDVLGTINFQAPDEATGTDAILVAAGIDAVSEGDFSSSSNATKLSFKTAASAAAAETMSLSSGGNLTVSGNVSVGGDLDVTGSFDMSDANITNVGSIALDSISGDADSNTSITFSGSDVITFATGGSTAFTANADQTVTFSAAVSGTSADFDGGVTIDNITIDGTEIDLSSGDLTIDVAGNIFLNADGGDIRLVDASTQFGVLQNNSSDFVIQSSVSDKDILLKGNDDSSGITALTLDMSDAGKALFNAGATFASKVSITTADNSPQLELISTDADGNSGPQLNFSRTSGSPADDDYIGRMNFIGRNDAGQDFVGVDVLTRINDVTDGTEDASFFITTMENGSQVSKMEFLPGETVFNQGGASVDFKVEGDTDANNLVVDASGDRVGIGVAAPASKLEISAGGNSHGLLRLDETDASNLSGYMQFDSNGTNKANVQNANNAGIHLCVGTGGTVTFTNLGYTAANALDDYEEGTWTPAFTSTSATFSYNNQGGNYTKVGRLIMCSFLLQLGGSPGGTTSNSVVVSGLPFASATLQNTYHGGSIGHYFNFNLSSTGVMAYQTHSSGSTVELKVVGDNLGETGVLASHMGSNAQIRGQIIYHTA